MVLLSEATSKVPAGYILPPDGGRSDWFLGGLLTWKARGRDASGQWELVEQRGKRGFAAPIHAHHRETEGFYVVEGEVTFLLNAHKSTAGARSFVLVPPKTPHAFVVESREARFLTIVSPGGFSKFFDSLSRRAPTPSLPGPESPMPTDRELEDAIKNSGQDLLGPPPAPRHLMRRSPKE